MVQTLDADTHEIAEVAEIEDLAEAIPASRLAWPGATPAQLAFMRAVYGTQVARAAHVRRFVADLPAAELAPIEGGKEARTAAAGACRNLLIAARAALARRQATGDTAARRVARIGVASGYRSASRQFRGWQSAFPRYYRETAAARARLAGGPHGPAAVQHLARYIGARLAAPGYSLHTTGLAIDFTTRDGGRDLGPRTRAANISAWRASWFFAWMTANAARYNFYQNTSIDEPWHWEYRAAGGAWPATRAHRPAAAPEPAPAEPTPPEPVPAEPIPVTAPEPAAGPPPGVEPAPVVVPAQGAEPAPGAEPAAGTEPAVGTEPAAGTEPVGTEPEPAEGIAGGREEIARVPLLSGHRGTPPDLILRWNALPDRPEVVDVVVHLHGYSGNRERMSLSRDKEPDSGLDFADPDSPGTLGRTRPTLGILPRGNYFGGRSGAGYNFPALVTPVGLRDLIAFSLARLGAATGSPEPRMGRLIVTAHSGGGAALMQILRHLDPDEVQVFDGLYGDASALSRWAQARIRRDAAGLARRTGDEARAFMQQQGGALRVLFRPDTAMQAHSLAVHRALRSALAAVPEARAVLAAWYRVERTSVGHGAIPRRFGRRLLADAAATLPAARSATDDVDAEDLDGEDVGAEGLDEEGIEASLRAGSAAGRGARIRVAITGATQGAFKSEVTGPNVPLGGGIEAVGYAYEVSAPRDQATGQATGKRRHGPVSVTKEWGAASPQIFQALTSNEVLSSVQIDVWRRNLQGVEVLDHTVRLSNARVMSIKQYAEPSPGDARALRPLEEISFDFRDIEIESKTGNTAATDSWQASR